MQLWVFAATLVAAGLLTPWVSAEVVLRPAEDGRLGAWLVLGPIPGALTLRACPQLAPELEATVRLSGWASRWRLLAATADGLDLARELGVGARDGARALAGGELRVEHDLEAWLLLSADGGASLWVDGQPVWARDVERRRDRSWDVIPLRLTRGRHPLLLALHQSGPSWAFALRILDQTDLLPPKNLRLVLPAAMPAHALWLQERMLEASVEAGLHTDGYRPRVRLGFPVGFPEGDPLPIRIGLKPPGRDSPSWEGKLGSLAPSERANHPWVATLPRSRAEHAKGATSEQAWEALIQVGSVRITRALLLDPEAPRALERASRAQTALRAGQFSGLLDGQVLEATLDLYTRRLRETLGMARSGVARSWIDRINALVAALEQGQDPLSRPGVLNLARWSGLDQQPTPMLVHVPRTFSAGTHERFPLVVVLHGYDGTPEGVLRAFVGTQRDGPHPQIDGFILAPHAYGNSFYRGPGEYDVLDALDWMLEHYPIDDQRVSITGVSMGGTGAAQLALSYAERFSAAASLCGYHSYFVRRDTAERPLRSWEIRQMHHWSPASWAANGRHVPLFVAQGTRDLPLSHSRVLVDAYRTLGYAVRTEWPETGHAVWEKVYAKQRLWPWLSRARRTPGPAHITLTTDRLRYGVHDWLRVTALEASAGLVQLDAERLNAEKVRVTARGVTGFELDRSRAKLASAQVVIEADQDSLWFGPNEPLAAYLDRGGWHAGAPARGERDKRAGLEGPLDDAFLGPLVFVYGTLDPRWTRANREVAETLARLRNAVQVRYPVFSDRDFDPRIAVSHSLVLVGHRENHALIRRLDAQLPMGVVGEAIRIGKRSYAGKDLGITFIHPNPEHADRYLVLVEGAGIPGLYYALSLPQLLPDFVLYDAAVAPAAGQQVLGRAHVLAAGYFQSDWSLPALLDDPLRP